MGLGHNCREESEKYEDTMFELSEEEEDINIELADAVEQCEMVKNRIHPPLSDVVTRIDSNFVVGDDDFYQSRYVLFLKVSCNVIIDMFQSVKIFECK